jgi:hypothetical protein
MTRQPHTSFPTARRLGLLGAGGLLGLLAIPLEAMAAPWGWTPRPARARAPYTVVTTVYPGQAAPVQARPSSYAYGNGYNTGYGNGSVAPYYRASYPAVQVQPGYVATPVLTEAQIAQRCSIGRLMGGIVGGGVGYVASRQDGRSWAVPLGALLGTQVGCNLGRGAAPVPW